MADAPDWIRLDELPAERWRAARLPDSSTDAQLLRLHADRASGAGVSLVRFPPGWSRVARGCYPVAEELAVLEGSLQLSGVTFAEGDYGWVAPGVAREAMTTPSGALVLALFTGPAIWSTDP